MFVAASTRSYAHLPFREAVEKIAHLEFSAIDLSIDEEGDHIKPSEVAADLERSLHFCRDTHRLDLAALTVNITAEGNTYYEQFAACCRLARLAKIVSITVPSAERGTPFNEEVERLRQLVAIAAHDGILVSMACKIDCLSEDPDTIGVLCNNVKGLGIALDPSHFVYGPHGGRRYDQILKYVYNVKLRDTKKDALQVRVGQGEIEYGRLVNQLRQHKYNRALVVDIEPMPEVDHDGEMRKLRLLLESLL